MYSISWDCLFLTTKLFLNLRFQSHSGCCFKVQILNPVFTSGRHWILSSSSIVQILSASFAAQAVTCDFNLRTVIYSRCFKAIFWLVPFFPQQLVQLNKTIFLTRNFGPPKMLFILTSSVRVCLLPIECARSNEYILNLVYFSMQNMRLMLSPVKQHTSYSMPLVNFILTPEKSLESSSDSHSHGLKTLSCFLRHFYFTSWEVRENHISDRSSPCAKFHL